ncbi:hypothetical protein C1H46_012049 [Malus baccata]|uniref:SNRNP25 ubiquitin-like domain-containing protein n=1 Tax=Malus baccata TaxID=106549 RepID=A0A540MV86_MALBA|nr:hypothetical protein C1H46_012049 [Malus baccata]
MTMEVDICEQELATNAAACSLFPASLSPRRLLSSSGRKNHAYQKLPQEPLTLFVIKLDGSSFEIQVSKTATVAELNEAVKDVFSQSSIDEMISWSHVWGNFCLCYEGQKLLDYKALIRPFGIKDGDKIFFVRHASIIKYEREKRRIGLWRKRICDISTYEQLVKL